MTIIRVDHTAIAVRDLDEAIPRYAELYGGTLGERTAVPDQLVEVVFLSIGDTFLELISPLGDTSGVSRFLQKQGESLHHIGLLVDDIGAELTRLSHAGVQVIDAQPRRGVHGLIAFLHPADTGGILVELVQHDNRSPGVAGSPAVSSY